MKILRVRKKFIYSDLELRIVLREESYMNALKPVEITRVLAPNSGMIPVNLKHKQTLKSIQEDTIKFLDNMVYLGADVKTELTKNI